MSSTGKVIEVIASHQEDLDQAPGCYGVCVKTEEISGGNIFFLQQRTFMPEYAKVLDNRVLRYQLRPPPWMRCAQFADDVRPERNTCPLSAALTTRTSVR